MCWLFGPAKVVAGMTINSLIVFERFPVSFVGSAPPSKIGRFRWSGNPTGWTPRLAAQGTG